MRIVVSGTHASGKSTLVSDFARRHPEFRVLPDPFESLDETWDGPSMASFATQLRIAPRRLDPKEGPENFIAERGPVDFLAYLSAYAEAVGVGVPREWWGHACAMTRSAMEHVDLLVVLPLTSRDQLAVGSDEHLALRDAMNDALWDLIDDSDVVGLSARVVEIAGARGQRLAALEDAVRCGPSG